MINTTLENYGLANGLSTPIPSGGKTLSTYIVEGGTLEDEDFPWVIRPMNHFHNPLKTWDQSGFSDQPIGKIASSIDVSNPVWAQEAGVNSLWAQETGAATGNLYSWPSAREYLYDALTATDENSRDTNFINCFHSIGQVMHLMEDLAVPAHTRNDSHINGNIYEEWVDYVRLHHSDIFNGYLSNYTYTPDPSLFKTGSQYNPPNPYAIVPIAGLFDADVYTGYNPEVTAGTVGLSEYTNANFFSENTIEKNFSYPNHTTFVDIATVVFPNPIVGGTLTRPYYKKMPGAGDSGYYLATVGALKYYVTNIIQVLHDNSIDPIFQAEIESEMGEAEQLDDYCYRDYACRLLPRAAGYSSALLQYFFRGQIDAVDAVTTTGTDDSGNSVITGVTLKVKNNTPSEDIGGGNLVVACRFKNQGDTDYSYTNTLDSSGNGVPIASLGHDQTTDTEITFTFSSPIPSDATDMQYMLVYRGQLGQEADAVAAKAFTISQGIKLIEIAPQYTCTEDAFGDYGVSLNGVTFKIKNDTGETMYADGSTISLAYEDSDGYLTSLAPITLEADIPPGQSSNTYTFTFPDMYFYNTLPLELTYNGKLGDDKNTTLTADGMFGSLTIDSIGFASNRSPILIYIQSPPVQLHLEIILMKYCIKVLFSLHQIQYAAATGGAIRVFQMSDRQYQLIMI